MNEDPCALYRLFDSAGRLLYVGVSNDPERRLRQHALEKPWASSVASHSLEWFDTRDLARDREAQAVFSERPSHNVKHQARPGRPFMPAGSYRRTGCNGGELSEQIVFRVTKAEKAAIKAYADEHGLTISQAVRLLVLRGLAAMKRERFEEAP